MKSLVIVSVLAALAGLGLGAVWAYFEVPRVVSHEPSASIKPSAGQQVIETTAVALPKAVFPETVFEFGKIERGASMSHAFKVRNVGKLPLRVEVTSTTCKCTVGDLEKNVIEPGDESEVVLEWVAKTKAGPFRHGAVLSTNDPGQTSVQLTVEGKVVESTALSPAELTFGTVKAGESSTASLYLMTFLDGQELKILSYELSNQDLAPQMDIQMTAANPQELPSPDVVGGLKVAATYRSGKTVGVFRSWLTLKTNLPQAEKLTVPILGRVVGDASIFGPGWNAQKGVLRMGAFSGKHGKQVSLKVAVRGARAQAAQWSVAEVDPPQLKASLGEPRKMGEELTHVPLKVEVLAGTAPLVRLGEPVSSDAHIVLRADQEEIPEVRLRVRFAVE